MVAAEPPRGLASYRIHTHPTPKGYAWSVTRTSARSGPVAKGHARSRERARAKAHAYAFALTCKQPVDTRPVVTGLIGRLDGVWWARLTRGDRRAVGLGRTRKDAVSYARGVYTRNIGTLDPARVNVQWAEHESAGS